MDSYCTRCKLNLNHIIIAMIAEKIVKVKCRTCGSVHSYRNIDKMIKGSRERGSGSSGKRPAAVKNIEALWQAGIAEAKSAEMPYDMGKAYRAGDIMVHTAFGKGIVQKADFKKCTVLFRDKERVLVTSNI